MRIFSASVFPWNSFLLITNSVTLGFIQSLLDSFAENAKTMYGVSFMSYNVHPITHLTVDYKKYGNLENISAFPCESYLGSHIKQVV